MITTVGSALIKRAISSDDDNTKPKLDSGTLAVGFLFLIIVIPAYTFVNYTLNGVYPTLAIIEDENPPAYEPLSLHEQSDNADAERTIHITGSKPTAGVAKPVTASIRSIYRLVKSTGGFRAQFRGFWCFFTQLFLTSILKGAFAFMGTWFTPIATLIASLALVQFSTAWVHIVITPRSDLHFWQRLPAYRPTLRATYRAVLLSWISVEVADAVPYMVGYILGTPIERIPNGMNDNSGNTLPPDTDGLVWKLLVIVAVGLMSIVFIATPAQVILVRVQASLLPEDRDPIVPFDRSFQGTVEPAVVNGKGYVTVREAWKTFSKSAWRRLIVLYAKVFSITLAMSMVLALAFGGVMFIALRNNGNHGEWESGPASAVFQE